MKPDRPLATTIHLQHAEEVASKTPLYVNSRQRPDEFRVTLVTPADVPRWVNAFVRLANGDSWISLTALPMLEAQGRPSSKLPADVRALLAIERLRFRNAEGMLDPVPISTPNLARAVAGTSHGQRLVHLRHRLETLRPDLVMLLGASGETEEYCLSPEWISWRLDAGITDPFTAGIALLAPVLRHEYATRVELGLYSDGARIGVETSWGATKPGSFHLQREEAFRKMPALLLRILRRVAAGQLELPRPQLTTVGLASTSDALGAFAGARALTASIPHTARWQWRKRRAELPWFVALRDDLNRLDPEAPRASSNKMFASPKGTYWADPCAVADEDRSYLFVEEVTAQRKRGVIACIELLKDGNATRLGVALEEPWHLSYPQPFNWNGEWYMTVESKGAQRVILYRADAFPLRWSHFVNLVEGRKCVDPTLHHHEGHWYLFVNASESGGSTWDELFLFVSEDLYGPYQPHPCNPIVSDVRRARPAGRLFTHRSRLIRPSQDCARSYGAAIVFNEVLELSPTSYRERPLSRLDPFPGLDGCHTYNAIDGMEVIDARGVPPRSMPRVVVMDTAAGPPERP